MISADRTERKMRWAVERYRKRVRDKLRQANTDKRLPLTTKPVNEVEELALLQQKLPQLQQFLNMPPDPAYEAQRAQAQEDIIRWMELSLKLRGQDGQP